MADTIKNFINRKFGTQILSKWIVLGFDIVITIFTYGLAYILRFNFNVEIIHFSDFVNHTLITTGIFAISFLIFKSYDGIIRHSGMADAERLIKAGATATIICISLSIVNRNANIGFAILPISIAIIHVVLNISLLAFSRHVIKLLFNQSAKNNVAPIPLIIYGAGRRGVSVLNALRNDSSKNYIVSGFIDDNNSKVNKTIEGIKIYHPSKLTELIQKFGVKELIIGIHTLDNQKKIDIVEICLQNQIYVRYVPPVENWINGTLSLRQLRAIHIEDLLGRDPIIIENEKITSQISRKTILVSGGAGSIGSELVRQILAYNPKKIILIDQSESALYDLYMELYFRIKSSPNIQIETIICDITNEARLELLFEQHKPQIIFHAAAYKHVPLMETNPLEAVHVNIFGSKILVDLAIAFHVEKFILISTDKAVNPTNVMGASKRIAEIYVQEKSKATDCETVFITTRFGNVLGSNGSVVNYFRKQIEAGGPITITHPEVTRYFMTISEACKLVLEAATMGKTSEIYLFDMGLPIKIIDLASKMVQLSGLKPKEDIQFVFTGLRPGEKLYEEMLNTNENTLPTHHHKIKIALTDHPDSGLINESLEQLWIAMQKSDTQKVVRIMKALVPEFKSKNSSFEGLDKVEGNSALSIK